MHHTHETEYDWNDKLQDDGAWNRLKGKVREEYAEVTDQQLEELRGNWEQFVGFVQQKSGETAEIVERKFRELFN